MVPYTVSGVPTGHGSLLTTPPASELAGYYQRSLRDQRLQEARLVDSHCANRSPADLRSTRPGGTSDSSPAFQRWVGWQIPPHPVGTPEIYDTTRVIVCDG